MPRKQKKDESLEVRLPHETKQAFMDRCKAEGRTASEAVRDFIDAHLARPLQQEPPMRNRSPMLAAAAAAAGAIVIGVVAVTPSHAKPDLAAMFRSLDANHDGVVSAEEFAAAWPGSQHDIHRQGRPWRFARHNAAASGWGAAGRHIPNAAAPAGRRQARRGWRAGADADGLSRAERR